MGIYELKIKRAMRKFRRSMFITNITWTLIIAMYAIGGIYFDVEHVAMFAIALSGMIWIGQQSYVCGLEHMRRFVREMITDIQQAHMRKRE